MKRKLTLIVLILVAGLVFLSGCGSGGKSDADQMITITATNNGWDSQIIHNEIAKLVVENAYDNYVFELSTGSSTINWQAIIAGDVDLDIESWTDNVATYADDLANGDIVDVGILVADSAQGLYVPRYVIEGDPDRGIKAFAPDLKTVEDLKKYAEIFPDDEDASKGRIYGSIPGWMADEVLYKKYQFYGLDEMYNYARLGSEATLFASLSSAYNLGEPWVGYCYEPAWIAGKLDLVLLEDAPYDPDLLLEGKCEFPKQELKIISSNKFADKAPDLLEFFGKYQTGSELISNSLAHLDKSGDSHEEVAKWLLRENDYLLDDWLPAEKADTIRSILN